MGHETQRVRPRQRVADGGKGKAQRRKYTPKEIHAVANHSHSAILPRHGPVVESLNVGQ
jgi:hypothetical protein